MLKGIVLQADTVAGLTVGVMTVPQALSYARTAGLPSEYALYGAFTPVLAYAMFGSSPQLVRGPANMPAARGGIGIVPQSKHVHVRACVRAADTAFALS